MNDAFEAAGPEKPHDLVASYLQSEGWSIYAISAKLSKANHEFAMVNAFTGEKAGTQAKIGNISHLKAVRGKFESGDSC